MQTVAAGFVLENTQTKELLLDSLRIDLQTQGYSDTASDFFNTE